MPNVLIILAPGCEELEAVTVINICRRAGFHLVSVGLDKDITPVRCSRGTVIVPDSTLDAEIDNDFDLLVLPGGQPGTDNLRKNERVRRLVVRMVEKGKYVAAICAAPMVLAEAGVLAGRQATSFPGCLAKTGVADLTVLDSAVVKDGNIITSRGPGTAMDFALELVSILSGPDQRAKVESGLCREK